MYSGVRCYDFETLLNNIIHYLSLNLLGLNVMLQSVMPVNRYFGIK